MEKHRTELKTRFETGDRPTQQDFYDFIDSYVHKLDDTSIVIPPTSGQAGKVLKTDGTNIGWADESFPDAPVNANKYVRKDAEWVLLASTQNVDCANFGGFGQSFTYGIIPSPNPFPDGNSVGETVSNGNTIYEWNGSSWLPVTKYFEADGVRISLSSASYNNPPIIVEEGVEILNLSTSGNDNTPIVIWLDSDLTQQNLTINFGFNGGHQVIICQRFVGDTGEHRTDLYNNVFADISGMTDYAFNVLSDNTPITFGRQRLAGNDWVVISSQGAVIQNHFEGDGWGNDAVKASDGFFRRYTLSENQNNTMSKGLKEVPWYECGFGISPIGSVLDSSLIEGFFPAAPNYGAIVHVVSDSSAWYSNGSTWINTGLSIANFTNPICYTDGYDIRIVRGDADPQAPYLPVVYLRFTEPAYNVTKISSERDICNVPDNFLGVDVTNKDDTLIAISSYNFTAQGSVTRRYPFFENNITFVSARSVTSFGHHFNAQTNDFNNWVGLDSNQPMLITDRYSADGWGNNATLSSNGFFERFSLSETEYQTFINLAQGAPINIGIDEPSSPVPFMYWADTGSGIMKLRNETNDAWINLFYLNGQVIRYMHFSATEPPDKFPCQLWADSDEGGYGYMKMRSKDNTSWIKLFRLQTGGVDTAPVNDNTDTIANTNFVQVAISNHNTAQEDAYKKYVETFAKASSTSNTLRREYPAYTMLNNAGQSLDPTNWGAKIAASSSVLVNVNDHTLWYSLNNGASWADVPQSPSVHPALNVTNLEVISSTQLRLTFSASHTYAINNIITLGGIIGPVEVNTHTGPFIGNLYIDRRSIYYVKGVTSNTITIDYPVPTYWTGEYELVWNEMEGYYEQVPIPGTGVWESRLSAPYQGGGIVTELTDYNRVSGFTNAGEFFFLPPKTNGDPWFVTNLLNGDLVYDPETDTEIYTPPHWVKTSTDLHWHTPYTTGWMYCNNQYFYLAPEGIFTVTGLGNDNAAVRTLFVDKPCDGTNQIYHSNGMYFVIDQAGGGTGEITQGKMISDVGVPTSWAAWTTPIVNPIFVKSQTNYTLANISKATRAVITTVEPHPFTERERVYFTGITSGMTQMNNVYGTIYQIIDEYSFSILRDSSSYTTWDSGLLTATCRLDYSNSWFYPMFNKYAFSGDSNTEYYLSDDAITWTKYTMPDSPIFDNCMRLFFRFLPTITLYNIQYFSQGKTLFATRYVYYTNNGAGVGKSVIATTYDGIDWVYNDIGDGEYTYVTYDASKDKFIMTADHTTNTIWWLAPTTATLIHTEMFPLSEPKSLPVADDNTDALGLGYAVGSYYRTPDGHLMVVY